MREPRASLARPAVAAGVRNVGRELTGDTGWVSSFGGTGGGTVIHTCAEGAENQIFNQNLSTSLPKPTDVGPVTSIHPTQINRWFSRG